MPTPAAASVARAVARTAELRGTALDAALAAHTALVAADTAITTARQNRAQAGPALARAIDTALAAGITTDQLADLGITIPAARTRRRATATHPDPPRPPADPTPGHDPAPDPATRW